MGNLLLIAIVIAVACYIVGGLASYLLEWLVIGKRRNLMRFLFKPWA